MKPTVTRFAPLHLLLQTLLTFLVYHSLKADCQIAEVYFVLS